MPSIEVNDVDSDDRMMSCWCGKCSKCGMNRQEGACIVRSKHLPKQVEVLEIIKSICTLGREIMLVLGFDGNKSYNSGSGMGSPTIIRLGLWEGQVS